LQDFNDFGIYLFIVFFGTVTFEILK